MRKPGQVTPAISEFNKNVRQVQTQKKVETRKLVDSMSKYSLQDRDSNVSGSVRQSKDSRLEANSKPPSLNQ